MGACACDCACVCVCDCDCNCNCNGTPGAGGGGGGATPASLESAEVRQLDKRFATESVPLISKALSPIATTQTNTQASIVQNMIKGMMPPIDELDEDPRRIRTLKKPTYAGLKKQYKEHYDLTSPEYELLFKGLSGGEMAKAGVGRIISLTPEVEAIKGLRKK